MSFFFLTDLHYSFRVLPSPFLSLAPAAREFLRLLRLEGPPVALAFVFGDPPPPCDLTLYDAALALASLLFTSSAAYVSTRPSHSGPPTLEISDTPPPTVPSFCVSHRWVTPPSPSSSIGPVCLKALADALVAQKKHALIARLCEHFDPPSLFDVLDPTLAASVADAINPARADVAATHLSASLHVADFDEHADAITRIFKFVAAIARQRSVAAFAASLHGTPPPTQTKSLLPALVKALTLSRQMYLATLRGTQSLFLEKSRDSSAEFLMALWLDFCLFSATPEESREARNLWFLRGAAAVDDRALREAAVDSLARGGGVPDGSTSDICVVLKDYLARGLLGQRYALFPDHFDPPQLRTIGAKICRKAREFGGRSEG
jgi:hypothetical protein